MKNIASVLLLLCVAAALIGCEQEKPRENDPCDTIIERRSDPNCVDRKAPGTAQLPPILPTDQIVPITPLPVPLPAPAPTPRPVPTQEPAPTPITPLPVPQEKQQTIPFINTEDLV